MPFLMDSRGFGFGEELKCPKTQTHQFVYLCRNGSRRCRLLSLFQRGSIVHQLESLILAQNERWRHA